MCRKLRRSILTMPRGPNEISRPPVGHILYCGRRPRRRRRLAELWRRRRQDAALRAHADQSRQRRRLELAWQYDTGEKGDTQTQPIVIGRTLFGYTPSHKTFALDAATGKQLWLFDSGIAGIGANRGLMYWADGKDARDFRGGRQFRLRAECRHGQADRGFGNGGRIDLRENLGRDPSTQSVRLTSPGVIYRDLMIVGGRVARTCPPPRDMCAPTT